MESGVLPSDKFCDRIPVEEWNKLELKKCYEFNYFPDIVALLDDKGISPPCSKMNQLFAKDALISVGRTPVKKLSNTRLIAEALERPEIMVEEMFDQVRSTWTLPEEWTLIQLKACLLYTSPSPRDKRQSRMPSSA